MDSRHLITSLILFSFSYLFHEYKPIKYFYKNNSNYSIYITHNHAIPVHFFQVVLNPKWLLFNNIKNNNISENIKQRKQESDSRTIVKLG